MRLAHDGRRRATRRATANDDERRRRSAAAGPRRRRTSRRTRGRPSTRARWGASVAARPSSFVAHARGRASASRSQSRPVESRRWTRRTSTSRSTIGTTPAAHTRSTAPGPDDAGAPRRTWNASERREHPEQVEAEARDGGRRSRAPHAISRRCRATEARPTSRRESEPEAPAVSRRCPRQEQGGASMCPPALRRSAAVGRGPRRLAVSRGRPDAPQPSDSTTAASITAPCERPRRRAEPAASPSFASARAFAPAAGASAGRRPTARAERRRESTPRVRSRRASLVDVRPQLLRPRREDLARAAQARGDGPGGDAEEARDLRHRQLLELREHEDGPELRRQLVEDAIEQGANLTLGRARCSASGARWRGTLPGPRRPASSRSLPATMVRGHAKGRAEEERAHGGRRQLRDRVARTRRTPAGSRPRPDLSSTPIRRRNRQSGA